MMKYFLIGLIKIYQLIPGKWHNMCRHIPSCSNYGIEAISYYGTIKGTYLTIWRVLKCNPLGKPGYDPLPRKEDKIEKN